MLLAHTFVFPVIEPGVAGIGFTVIVIELDVAGEPVTQASLDDRIHVTTSPLFKPVLV